MADTILSGARWKTSTPPIYITLTYDNQRSGADMQYMFHISIAPSGIASNGVPWRFGYNMISKIYLDGTLRDTHMVKASSPATWSSAITYDTGWITVSGKTSGTTTLKFNFSSENGWTADWSASLTVAPGKSSLTVPPMLLNRTASFVIDKIAGTPEFKHTLIVRAGGETYELLSKSASLNADWLVPMELADAEPNAMATACQLTLQTYTEDGETLLGLDEQTAEISFSSEEAALKPDISLAITYNQKYGAAVQNKVPYSVSVLSPVVHGSGVTAAAYTVANAGEKIRINENEIDETVTITPDSYGSFVLTVTVTNSRQLTSTAAKSISVFEYYPPDFKQLTGERAKDTGEPADDGQYLAWQVDARIAPVNGRNRATMRLQVCPEGGSNWATIAAYSGYSWTASGVSEAALLDEDLAYMFRVQLQDDWTTVNCYASNIPSSFSLLDFFANGKGLAFGRAATKEGLDIDMVPYLRRGLGGVRLAQGTDFNTLLTTGKYWVHNVSDAASMKNCPSAYGGHLYVIPFRAPEQREVSEAWNYAWQIYVAISTDVYIRRVETGASASAVTFTGWRKLADELDPEEQKLRVTFVSSKSTTSREFTYDESTGATVNTGMLSLCVILSYKRAGITRAVLIDSGSDYNAAHLIEALQRLNVSVIDAIMMTHWHGDHWHGLRAIDWTTKTLGPADLSNAKLYCPHGGFKESRLTAEALANISGYLNAGKTMIQTFQNAGLTCVFPTEGETVSIGDALFTFNNVSDAKFIAGDPESSYHYFYGQDDNQLSGPDYNNFSMIISVERHDSRLVFAGDVSMPAAKANADVICGADVFQVNHHGLNISEPRRWLSAIGARYSVIPTYGNMYLQDREPWEVNNLHPSHLRCSDVGTLLTTAYNDVVFDVGPGGCLLEQGEPINRKFYDYWLQKITAENVNPSVSGITLTTNETQIEKRGDVVIVSFRFYATNRVPGGTPLFINLGFDQIQNVLFALTTTAGHGISAGLRHTAANGTHIWIYNEIPAGSTVYGQAVAFCKNTMGSN